MHAPLFGAKTRTGNPQSTGQDRVCLRNAASLAGTARMQDSHCATLDGCVVVRRPSVFHHWRAPLDLFEQKLVLAYLLSTSSVHVDLIVVERETRCIVAVAVRSCSYAASL
jgi:hypothetical protein